MTSEEFSQEVLAYIPKDNDRLRALIAERILGVGREYEIDENTLRVEAVQVSGLIRDLEEELVDAIVYAAALDMRMMDGMLLIIGYLRRAHVALVEFDTESDND